MKVIETKLPGLVIIEPRLFNDARGYFFETFQKERYQQHGVATQFVQDNFSRSERDCLRGLHYQLEHPQGKLVFVISGKVLDVVVDIRQGSPTFGQHHCMELSEENHRQLYIPPGFAHGFCVLSQRADFVYKCTDYYCPQSEYGIAWNDPDLQIPWTISQPILSEKDAHYPQLKNMSKELLPVF